MKKLFPSAISRLQWLTVFFFAVVYSLISLVNHYNFRTYALDLGIFNNAIYDYSHFRFNDCMLLQPQLNNLLGDHFELFLFLLAPFRYILGTYTLLVFQILFILFGGIGVYQYIKEISHSDRISFLAQLHFYFFFGIFSALDFDYHNNVIGAMLVPWFFYFFHRENWKKAIVFFILIISTKENMALWLAFICAGISLLYWRNKVQRLVAFAASMFSFTYFLLAIQIIIPSLANPGTGYFHIKNNYSLVGSGWWDITVNLLSHPLLLTKCLFLNHIGNAAGDYLKAETYFFVLISGGIFLFLRPQFWLMLFPVVAQKMLSSDIAKWGVSAQYSIEFAPVISMGIFYVISKIKYGKKYYAFAAVCLCLVITIRCWNNTYTWFNRSRQRIYQPGHYEKNYDVAEAHRALKLIPENAKVSAQSPFVPHLAFRDYIYQFPVINDAEFVVVSFAEEIYYPLTKEEFAVRVDSLFRTGNWKKIYEKNGMVIMKKKNQFEK